MADLSVTIGLDQKELEAGLAQAGKSIGNLGKNGQAVNPFQATANKLSTAQGIGSMIGGPIGGIVGAFFDAFGGMIASVIGKIKEIADYAKQIRLSSISTGLGIDRIRQLEAIGEAFGVSLNSMTKAVVDFQKKMGEARIRGGEVTNILAKMGVGMNEIANGSFDATMAMKMLADAYAAGTDEATLLYYGTRLFGDSFRDLLPLIKAGSRAIEDASRSYYNADEDRTSAAARLANMMDNLWRSTKNVFIDLIGGLHSFMETLSELIDNMLSPGFWNPFEKLKDKVRREISNAPKYLTNDELIKRLVDDYAPTHSKEQTDAYRKEVESQIRGNGKKLSPFGLSEAGAASNLQQMGGGDIFGAVAFTPLDRIAEATEETARNTKPLNDSKPVRPPDTPAR